MTRTPRAALLLLLASAMASQGCASTVLRLDGEFSSPGGTARTPCEQREWLVAAPTRAQVFDQQGRHTANRDDGVGLYRVGSSAPESIPGLAPELHADDQARVAVHRAAVRPHDTQRWIAAGLGATGLLAIVAGSILFVSAFSSREGNNEVNRPRAVWGGALAGLGFGIGIAGTVVNPNQTERSRASAARYVFLPPADERADVLALTGRHNERVRARCGSAP